MELRLVHKGDPTEKRRKRAERRAQAYANAIGRLVKERSSYEEQGRTSDYDMKLALLQIKQFRCVYAIDKKSISFEALEEIMDSVSRLTPGQLVNLFPISKDKQDYPRIDYESTMEHLKSFSWNKPMGDDVWDALFSYANEDILKLNTAFMVAADKEFSKRLGCSPIERFAEDNDVELFSKQPNGMLVGDRGTVLRPSKKARKRVPSYLRLVQ